MNEQIKRDIDALQAKLAAIKDDVKDDDYTKVLEVTLKNQDALFNCTSTYSSMKK